jgi:PAS domain S-box-containing protein
METDDSIRILFVEDVPSDAEIAAREIQKNGIQFTSARVDTKEAFIKALEEFRPDIIISDYSMPQFDGMQALKLVKEHSVFVPFILLTGSMNEETAVECMKAGASDYVIKERIIRLPFAVREALLQKKNRLEKEEARQALRENQARLNLALRSAEMGVWHWDIIENKRSFDNQVCHLLGINPAMFNGSEEEFFGAVHPEDRETIKAALAKTIEQNVLYETEYRSVWPDSSVHYINARGRLVRNDKGQPLRINGVVWDITKRKQAEEKLRESEEQFRAMFEVASIGIAQADIRTGQWLRVNHKMCDITGYSSEEMLRMRVSEITHPDDRQHDWEEFQRVVRGEAPNYHLEKRYIRKDGTIVWVNVNMTVIRDSNGQAVRTMATIEDITFSKQVEEELRKLSRAMEQSPSSVIITDLQGNIEYVNPKFAEVTGYSPEEVRGKNPRILKSGETPPEEYRKLWKTITAGDEWHGVFHNKKKDGTLFWERVSISSVRDTSGAITHFLAVKEDITNQKSLEDQYRQSQKMEAVGQLAGGVAHDFNNILTAVIGYAHMLKMKLKDDDTLKTYADHILSLSDRAANLTQSLLAFSRKQITNPRPVNLNGIIGRINHLLSRIIGEDIKLQTMLSGPAQIVMADPGQIEQVLMNLATNARDAMREGGLITIETETVDIDQSFIDKHGFGKEGQYAVISVTDTGIGMDKETREKIFEPFYTTKEVGKGTGLGLAMVYGIIKQHDGYINVYSEPGKGTTFRIYLPLVQATAETLKITPEVINALETGTETILLAEDENEVRAFNKRLLEEYGYKVIEAIDGDDAIDKFKLHKDKIQLLLLDVIMPNRNGNEVYRAIREIAPDIKVLFSSGYPAQHIQGIIAEGSPFILKPVSPTKLLKKIREVLNE